MPLQGGDVGEDLGVPTERTRRGHVLGASRPRRTAPRRPPRARVRRLRTRPARASPRPAPTTGTRRTNRARTLASSWSRQHPSIGPLLVKSTAGTASRSIRASTASFGSNASDQAARRAPVSMSTSSAARQERGQVGGVDLAPVGAPVEPGAPDRLLDLRRAPSGEPLQGVQARLGIEPADHVAEVEDDEADHRRTATRRDRA